MAIAKNVRNQTRTEVTSQVDGIASLPTEASTDAEDEEEERQGEELAGIAIFGIGQGENDEHENAGCDKLGKPHRGTRHELGGIRAENAGGGEGADANTTLEVVNGEDIVAVDDEGAGHGTQDLSDGIDGKFSPGVAAEQAVGKGNGWVKVTAGLFPDIHTQHDTETVHLLDCFLFAHFNRDSDLPPTPRNALIVTLFVLRQQNLSNDAIAKQNHDHGGKEF